MAQIAEVVPVLDDTMKAEITHLLRTGRRVSEVIAHGLARPGGWRRQHVIAVVTENAWSLDSDERIPRRFRTCKDLPRTALPGQPLPAAPREPVAEYPPEGTVTEGRGANAAAALIAVGKTHDVPAIRRAAGNAEKALVVLRNLLKDDENNQVLRNRLAQIEAEAQRIRDQLGVKKRSHKPAAAPSTSTATATAPGRGGNKPPTAATLAKPINHGTWGGWLQHNKRGIAIPADDSCGCNAAKDTQVARMRAKSPRGGNRG